jgi:hypothetical protein
LVGGEKESAQKHFMNTGDAYTPRTLISTQTAKRRFLGAAGGVESGSQPVPTNRKRPFLARLPAAVVMAMFPRHGGMPCEESLAWKV